MTTDTRKTLPPFVALALCLPMTACPDDDDDVAVTDTETTGVTGDGTMLPTTTMPPTDTEPTPPVTDTETDTGVNDTTVDDTGEPVDDEGEVRVVHLSPDAPGVDVFFDVAAPAVEDLEFTEGTPFQTVEAATYDVRLTANGDDPDDAIIAADAFVVPPGARFTLAAYGELENIELMVVEEEDRGIGDDMLRAFVGHAADGVNTVDVWAIGLEDDPVEVLSDLDYGEWEPLDLPADTPLTIGLDTDADGDPEFEFDLPGLPEGITLSLFAVLDDTGPFLIAYLPDGSSEGPIRPN